MSKKVAQDLGRRFGVLRRARTVKDELPARDRVLRTARSGENPDLARLVATTAYGARYFLMPADGTVCMVDEEGSGGCPAPGTGLDGDFTVAFCAPGLPAGSVRILGVLPDGVDAIDVVAEDGATTRFAVTDNAVVADVPIGDRVNPQSINWRGAGGAARTFDLSGPWQPPGPCR